MKIKMHKHRLIRGSDNYMQFHDKGEEFNMSKLEKFPYEDE